jgi:uracil-DNA glycosylase
MTWHDLINLPSDWKDALAPELSKPYFRELAGFLEAEGKAQTLFPAAADVYNALRYTPLGQVRVMLLGQDPYHDVGQAHGLCFSVPEGVRPPPSLVNIFKELKSDIGTTPPAGGCLTRWAEQGVLLLNAVLTVRAHEANSHKNRGWEKFTDAVIDAVNQKRESVVFVLWGGYAQKKESRIDVMRHTIIKSAHPSPLSAHNGFFGSKPFSKINQALNGFGKPEIEW